jgi:hypothetical protein
MSEAVEIVKPNEALERLNARFGELKARAEGHKITDQASYIQAGNLKVDIKSYLEAVENHFSPIITPLKEALDRAKNDKKTLAGPGEMLLDSIVSRMKFFAEQERIKTEQEQRRINEENQRKQREESAKERAVHESTVKSQFDTRRNVIRGMLRRKEISKSTADALLRDADAREKDVLDLIAKEADEKANQPAPEIKVLPNIPAVAGTSARRNWKFRIVDPSKIPARYLMPDEISIGQMVRNTKDKKKAEAECAGIEVWSE